MRELEYVSRQYRTAQSVRIHHTVHKSRYTPQHIQSTYNTGNKYHILFLTTIQYSVLTRAGAIVCDITLQCGDVRYNVLQYIQDSQLSNVKLYKEVMSGDVHHIITPSIPTCARSGEKKCSTEGLYHQYAYPGTPTPLKLPLRSDFWKKNASNFCLIIIATLRRLGCVHMFTSPSQLVALRSLDGNSWKNTK